MRLSHPVLHIVLPLNLRAHFFFQVLFPLSCTWGFPSFICILFLRLTQGNYASLNRLWNLQISNPDLLSSLAHFAYIYSLCSRVNPLVFTFSWSALHGVRFSNKLSYQNITYTEKSAYMLSVQVIKNHKVKMHVQPSQMKEEDSTSYAVFAPCVIKEQTTDTLRSS